MEDTIKTKRLELRILNMDFASQLLPIWSDEDVTRYTYINNINDLESCQKRLARMVESIVSADAVGPYAIFKEDTFIGIAAAYRHLPFEYGLFYHLAKDWWGHGYATEAAGAVVDAVFLIPGVIRISAEAVTANTASAKVLEKLGMACEGCLRKKFERDNVYYDLFAYSILKEEYLAQSIVR